MSAAKPTFPLLRTTLVCLLSNGEMGKSEIQKFVYLIERESVLRHGKLALGFRFRHDKFGMFSPDLANDLTSLETEGFLVSRKVGSDMGEGRKYRIAPGASYPPAPAIAELWDALQTERASGGLTGLIAYAKTTDPFVTTPQGGWVDWEEFARDQCGGPHVFLPEAEQELRRAAERRPARVLSREAALKELETSG